MSDGLSVTPVMSRIRPTELVSNIARHVRLCSLVVVDMLRFLVS